MTQRPFASFACLLALGLPLHAATLNPGDLIVGERSNNGTLVHIDAVGGDQTVISQGGFLSNIAGTLVEPSGTLLVATGYSTSGGGLVRVDPATGRQTEVVSGNTPGRSFDIPASPAYGPDGHIYFIDRGLSGPAGVFAYDPVTGRDRVVSAGVNLVRPEAMVFDNTGQIFVADTADGIGLPRIWRIDPASGRQTLLTNGGLLRWPIGMTFAPWGKLYIADLFGAGSGTGLIEIDPVSGFQRRVAPNADFTQPSSVAVDLNGQLIVGDLEGVNDGAIYRIDPLTGAQSTIARGNFLEHHYSVTVVPEPAALVFIACASCALFVRRPRPRCTARPSSI